MRRPRLKSDLIPDYPEDVARIVRIAAARGYDITEAEAEAAWEIRSREWSASWLELQESDDAVWADLTLYALDISNAS